MKLNKLNMNYNKSCFLLYVRSSNYYPWIDRLNFANMKISRTNCAKYLGVLIDECLSCREHIDYISLKFAGNVGILRKLKYIFPRDILKTLYYSLIHPYLLYCCSVWGSTFSSHLHHIQVLQNKTLGVFFGVIFKDSIQKRYIDCKILPLAGLITLYCSLFMYKYFQNCLPVYFKSMFELGSDIHTHFTRQSNIIRRPLAFTRRSQFSIWNIGPHAWNCLPTPLRNMNNVREFQRELKLFSFNIYGFDNLVDLNGAKMLVLF